MTHIRHIFLKRAFTASMLLLASIAVTPAMAAPVTFAFTGVLSNVPGSLNPPFNTTQTLSGFYTFNPSTPDSVANLNRGQYNGAVTGLTVNLGSYTATLENSGTNFIQIRNQASDR